ncbi:MAG: hypothetical protein KA715_04205 [Xanthomonadaceae bacterium]|nr:hypothetical protein [Xanthomonadaceae bacterium]
MKLLTIIILFSSLQAHAIFDCGFLLEQKQELGELSEILDQVQTYSEQGWIGKWIEKKENKARMVEIDSKLKKLGIGFTRQKLAYTFTDEGKHQINRVAKYLKKFGVTFTWEARIRASSASLETYEDPYKNERINKVFKQKAKDVSVSTETLKTILALNTQTEATVRHELLHIKTMLNLDQKKEGYFYGLIHGSTVFGYEALLSTDEIPANIEGILGDHYFIEKFPNSKKIEKEFKYEIEKTFLSTIGSYSKLYEEVEYMTGLYKNLAVHLEKNSWKIPELKSDYNGTYIENLQLESANENITIVFSTKNTKRDPTWIKNEVLGRLEFHRNLLEEIKSLKSEYAFRIFFRDHTQPMSVRFSDDKWSELVREIYEKMPTLRRMVEPMWAYKD